MKKLAVLSLSFMASACTQAGVFAVNAPTSFMSMTRLANVSYGDEKSQNLDIYIPLEVNEDTPVLMYLYGGGWNSGSKNIYKFMAARFVKEGYIVVIPDYRQFPDVEFPGFVHDVAKAMAWTKSNIQNYGGQNNSLLVMGHSAGAHIGSLVLADKKYLKEQKLDPSYIKAFVGLAGPYAFTPTEPEYVEVFRATGHDYTQMQAPTFVDGSEPPMLLLHGDEDEVVVYKNAQKLKEEVNKKGGKAEAKLYENVNHIDIVGAFSWLRYNNEIVKDVKSFLSQ